MGLGEIDLNVLLHIFSFLSVKDLCRCSMVCRRWDRALDEREHSRVWRRVLGNHPALRPFLESNLILKKLSGCKAKLVAFENAWNGNDCSPNIYLLENKLTLHRKPIAQSTDGIRGKCGYLRGQHYWTVTWHSPAFGSNAGIGVATSRESMHREGYCPLLGSTCDSWGWDISSGVLRYDGQEFASYPKTGLQVIEHNG